METSSEIEEPSDKATRIRKIKAQLAVEPEPLAHTLLEGGDRITNEEYVRRQDKKLDDQIDGLAEHRTELVSVTRIDTAEAATRFAREKAALLDERILKLYETFGVNLHYPDGLEFAGRKILRPDTLVFGLRPGGTEEEKAEAREVFSRFPIEVQRAIKEFYQYVLGRPGLGLYLDASRKAGLMPEREYEMLQKARTDLSKVVVYGEVATRFKDEVWKMPVEELMSSPSSRVCYWAVSDKLHE